MKPHLLSIESKKNGEPLELFLFMNMDELGKWVAVPGVAVSRNSAEAFGAFIFSI